MKLKIKSIHDKQDGLVSIIVAILIMLLLSLIVLAMAQNSRREQRQALDRQLSSQAFYAAESGINDAKEYLRNNADPSVDERTRCNDTSAGLDLTDSAFENPIDGPGGSVRYTCLLWDRSLDNILLGQVRTDEVESMPIESTDGSQITELTIEWQAKNAPAASKSLSGCTAYGSGANFPETTPASCDAGVLRVELINADPANLDRTLLKQTNYVAFFVPTNNAGTATTFYSNSGGSMAVQGSVVPVGCTTAVTPPDRLCKVTINGILAAATRRMQLVLISRYKDNSVKLTCRDNNGGSCEFKNGQAMIDSTGRAGDVLRRLQVRVPISTQTDVSPFAIQTGDSLCKLISIYPPPYGLAYNSSGC